MSGSRMGGHYAGGNYKDNNEETGANSNTGSVANFYDARHARGGHGRYGLSAASGHHRNYGQGGANTLPPNYLCDRCK